MTSLLARSLFIGSGFCLGLLHAAESATSPAAAKSPPTQSAPPSGDRATPKPEDASSGNATGAAARDVSAAKPEPPAGVKGMARDFGEQSKDLLTQRKALLARLDSAKTVEERRKILDEIRLQQQQRIDQQRELARQMREQLQLNRQREGGVIPTTK